VGLGIKVAFFFKFCCNDQRSTWNENCEEDLAVHFPSRDRMDVVAVQKFKYLHGHHSFLLRKFRGALQVRSPPHTHLSHYCYPGGIILQQANARDTAECIDLRAATSIS